MLGCSRVINQVASYILTAILVILITLAVFTYAASVVITSKENPKKWLKSEELRDDFAEYIVEKFYEDENSDFIEAILSEDDLKNIARENLNASWVDNSIDATVDIVYEWLEGDRESPELELIPRDQKGVVDAEKLARDSLGEISEYINAEKLVELSQKTSILNFEPQALEAIPDAYQSLQDLPRKLLVASGVVIVILMLASVSLRKGLFFTGLAALFAGGILIYSKAILEANPTIFGIILFRNLDLPNLSEMPFVMQRIVELAWSDIYGIMKQYGGYLVLAGIVLMLLTQLAVRTVIDDDYYRKRKKA